MGGVSTAAEERPRQVTMAGWMIMLGSGFVILTVWETVSRLRSLETRQAIEKFLAEPPGSGMGVSVEAIITFLHTSAMVAAGCATAAAILGWHVLHRNRQARVALAVVAVPLFLSGLVTGGFLSSLVAAAAAMLWLSPAREWFDGRSAAPADGGRDPNSAAYKGSGPPSPSAPPGLPLAPPPAGTPFGQAPAADRATRRPDAVNVAFVLTVVFSGLVLVMTSIAVAVMLTSPDLVLEEMRRQSPELAEQGISDAMLRRTTLVTGTIALLWSAGALTLALLMIGRRAWARTGLLVSAAVCAACCVLATLGSLVVAVPALASISVVACLRRPEVRAWFARRQDPPRQDPPR
jgi:uncharacterized membrane protein SpoIIM required for sporulation